MDSQGKQSKLLPRPQHYNFAHKILPIVFFINPSKFFELASKRGREYLLELWKLLEEDYTGTDFDIIPPDGLDVELLDLDDRTNLILVKLPEPRMMLEAYFVAAVYRRDHCPFARFFTSEYNHSTPDGCPVAFLCEWDASGNHGNMGVLEDNTVAGFIEAVRKKCKGCNPRSDLPPPAP